MIGWLSRLFRVVAESGATTSSVKADRGGVAAGRDIRDSTINIGIDEAEVQQRISQAQGPLIDQIKLLVDQISREKGVPVGSLQVVLAK